MGAIARSQPKTDTRELERQKLQKEKSTDAEIGLQHNILQRETTVKIAPRCFDIENTVLLQVEHNGFNNVPQGLSRYIFDISYLTKYRHKILTEFQDSNSIERHRSSTVKNDLRRKLNSHSQPPKPSFK